jgi:hypothetical protein
VAAVSRGERKSRSYPGSKVRHSPHRQDPDFRTDKDTGKSLIRAWFMAPMSSMAFVRTVADFGTITPVEAIMNTECPAGSHEAPVIFAG